MKKRFNLGSLRPVLRFFGSVKLAMLLLTVIIIATIVGTLVESRFDTAVAQQYVYDAPWFMTWLFLLGVNLIGAVLVRYPFKPHQLGFVITHAGIVVILIGAVVGRIWGAAGSVTLFRGQPPVDHMFTPYQALEVRAGGMTESKGLLLNLTRRPPTEKKPARLKVGEMRVAALGFAQELGLRSRVDKADSGGRPGLRVVLTSATAPQPFDQWLLLDDTRHGQLHLGSSLIRYASAPPAPSPSQIVEAPSEQPGAAPSREVHFAFAKMPDMNIVRREAGGPSGLRITFDFAAGHESNKAYQGRLELTDGQRTFTFAVHEIAGKTVPLEDTPWTLRVANYFADFRMEDRQPVSVSDEPNNPAVLFELIGPPVAAAQDSCHSPSEGCSMSEDECSSKGHHGGGHGKTAASELILFRSADGQLRYEARSPSQEPVRGDVEPGQPFSTGVADWQCRVIEETRHAKVGFELAPLSDDASLPTGSSGLLVRVSKGGEGVTEWIRMSQPTELRVAGETVDLLFGYQMQPLGFGVALDKFEVEMNEGTQNPACFKSHVRFIPSEGEPVERAVWMNNPANFPDFAGVGLLGTAYKFSQSSWNPNDLNQTTLQVIRDPGWSFKWIGSLLLCAGLITIFYVRPYPAFARAKAARRAAAQPQANPVPAGTTEAMPVK